MRVTLGMMNRMTQTNLSSSAENLLAAQNAASSGKKITKPSDDVAGTGRSMQLRSADADIEQYSRNCDAATAQLGTVSTTMDSIVGDVQKVRQLALQASSDSLSVEARASILTQLDSLTTQLVSAGNTQHLGSYVLSGTLSSTQPVVANAGGTPPYFYAGSLTQQSVQVADGVAMQTTVSGSSVFNMNGSAVAGVPDLFSTIKSLRDKVQAGDVKGTSASISDIDANLNNVVTIQAQIGARVNRVDSVKTMLSDSKTRIDELLSKTEDVDIVQAVVELQTKQNVYQAAISTASKVMQQSLVNYMN